VSDQAPLTDEAFELALLSCPFLSENDNEVDLLNLHLMEDPMNVDGQAANMVPAAGPGDPPVALTVQERAELEEFRRLQLTARNGENRAAFGSPIAQEISDVRGGRNLFEGPAEQILTSRAEPPPLGPLSAHAQNRNQANYLPRTNKMSNASLKNSDEANKAWLENFLLTFEISNFEWPRMVRLFFEGEPGAWVSALLAATPNITREEFEVAFARRFTGEVRSGAVVALESLVNQEITQGREGVSAYSEKFMHIARKLPGESQMSMCKHYVAGLNHELKVRCCLQQSGLEWETLESLIRYSFSEEIRVKTAASFSVPRSRFQENQGRAGEEAKKRRTAQGAVASGDPYGDNNGQSKKTTDGNSKRYNPPPGLPAVEDVEGYGTKGPLTPALRLTLRAGWVCCYCRKGRHATSVCPEKTKKGYVKPPHASGPGEPANAA
jgi:Retrotransposon gag protein